MSNDINTSEKLKLIELIEFFYIHYKKLNFKPIWAEFEKLKEEVKNSEQTKE